MPTSAARIEALRGESESVGTDRAALHRARRGARDLLRQLGAAADSDPSDAVSSVSVGGLLALAFPDRIGRRRAGGEGRFTLTNGRGAHFGEPQALSRQELIVAVDLDDRERDARIRLAAPLSREDIEAHLARAWCAAIPSSGTSASRRCSPGACCGSTASCSRRAPCPRCRARQARAAMLEGVRQLGIESLPWSREARDLQARVAFVRRLGA